MCEDVTLFAAAPIPTESEFLMDALVSGRRETVCYWQTIYMLLLNVGGFAIFLSLKYVQVLAQRNLKR